MLEFWNHGGTITGFGHDEDRPGQSRSGLMSLATLVSLL